MPNISIRLAESNPIHGLRPLLEELRNASEEHIFISHLGEE